jgi:hypothetical protein
MIKIPEIEIAEVSKYSPEPLLSVLIPSIPSRLDKMSGLLSKLEAQVSRLEDQKEVEILVFIDNKRRSIGYKRESLVHIARGKFLAFVDDDDDVEDCYVSEAVKAIKENPGVDVITLKEYVIINDSPRYELTFQLGHPNPYQAVEMNFTRPPWHSCFWRREIAQKYHFNDSMYGEDWFWASQLNSEAKKSYHIDKFMRTYKFNEKVTEAFS